jgi:hypothetical protein
MIQLQSGRGSTCCGSKPADNLKRLRTSLINSCQDSQGGCIPETRYSRMSDESDAAATLATRSLHDGPSVLVFCIAVVCLIWYVAVTLVSTLGYVQV